MINKDFLQELLIAPTNEDLKTYKRMGLEEYVSPTGARSPLAQDYFSPPKKSRINQDFVDSLAAGEHKDVQENKSNINPITGKPRKVYPAPNEFLRTQEVPEVLSEIEKRKTVGVGEELKQQGMWGLTKRLPGIGGSLAATKNIEITNAAKRLQSDVYSEMYSVPREQWTMQMIVNPHPKHLRREDLKLVNKFFDDLEFQSRKKGFWTKSVVGLLDMAPWMAEFAMTGGLAKLSNSATRKFGEKLLGKYALTKTGEMALRGAGWMGSAAARTTLGLGGRVAESYTQAGLPQGKDIETATIPEVNPYTNFAKAWGRTFIEAASEEAGEAISGRLLAELKSLKFGKAILKGVGKAWSKLSPENSMTKFWKNMTKKGGWSNMVGEVGEERLATFLHAIAGTESFGVESTGNPAVDIPNRLMAGFEQDVRNFPVEATVLSTVPGARLALGQVGRIAETPPTEAIPAPSVAPELITKPKAVEAPEAKVESDYVYHSAFRKNLESITKSGLKPEGERPVFFAQDIKSGLGWGNEGDPLFRVAKSDIPQLKEVGIGNLISKKKISPELIEVSLDKGKSWQPLIEAKAQPPTVAEAEPAKVEEVKKKAKEFTIAADTTADFPVMSDALLPQKVGGVMKYTEATGKYGAWMGSVKKVGDFLKKFARTVPEFTTDPVFTVSKDKMIVYQDGGRFQFKPETFGIDATRISEGQKIRVDLESYGIKVAKGKKLAKALEFVSETKGFKAPSDKWLAKEKAKETTKKLKAEQVKPKGGGAIGDIGVSGATGIDSGRIKVSMEPGAKPQTAGDIIDYMSRAFGIVIRGKATHHKQSLGWFDPKATGIRLKDVKSLTTGTHEVAHHIDWTLNNRMSLKPPSKQIADELMALGRVLYGSRKPPGGYKSEGWAEFIREYLTGEDAEEKAPNLYKWFTEEYLPSHKDMAKKIAKTRDMITKWRLQGAEARVDSQINKKQIKGPFSEWFKRGLLWIETSFRDEFAPIKRAMRRAGIREGELTPAEDPYQIAVARADKAGAIARQFVLEYTTDMAGNRTGKGLREILEPVAKDINAWTRWAYSAKARLQHKRGLNPGISKADADYVYEKYDNEVWQTALKEVTGWNNRVMDYLVEAGGLEKESADIIKAANPIYIPLMRAFKEGELRIAGGYGKGAAKVTKPIKKSKGSGREIIDPIESMIKQTQKIIAVAHKAEIAKAIANLATKKGMASMIWKVPAPKQATRFEAEQLKKDIARIAYERMGIDPQEISSAMLEHWDDVLTVYSNAGQYYGKDNIVALVINGKRQWYEVDPALYKAIEGVDQYALPWFLSVTFGKATRMVRLGATGLNPSFGLIRNFLRDAMTFTVLSKHAKAGPLSAVKGIAEDIIDTPSAKKFKAMGGKMSSQILADRRAVQNLRKHVLASTVSGKTIYTVAHPIDALRELFGITEAGTRIGEYGPALKAGEKKYGKGSKDAAIYALNQAQDVTTNFSRHGKIAKVLNQMIPFFNAAIQGPDKIIRTFGKRPVETSLKAILALTIPAIWLWWKYKDEEWYKNMPDHERVNYLHFKIPGKDTIIRIPVPFELGHIFQSAPVAALDAKYRKDPKIVNEMFEESLRQANPFDWPATFSPIIDIMANEDFAGRPIVTKSAEYKLPEDQYGNYTTELMKVIGKTIGYSPAKLEHLVASYSGGLYTRVARTIDLRNKKEITKSDMPILGTLFLREPYAPRAQLNRFYEKRDLLNQKYSSGKITGKEKRLRKKYNEISAELSEQWKKIPDAKTQKDKIRIYQKMKRQLNRIRE